MTNLKRESTIKKSTTHVVSGAFLVAHSWTISLSDNWIIAFVVLVVNGAFDVVKSHALAHVVVMLTLSWLTPAVTPTMVAQSSAVQSWTFVWVGAVVPCHPTQVAYPLSTK